jgi:hypothetical protein
LNSDSVLPISEELLGAYIEGNTNTFENGEIESAIENNESLSSLWNELQDDIYDNEFGGDFNSNDVIDINDDLIYINELQETNFNNLLNMDDYEKDTSQTSSGAVAASRLFGDKGNGPDPKFDNMIFQGNEGVCAIRSQQIVLRDYGIDVSLEELKQYAIANGWYSEDGTPMCYIGCLLDACGVNVRQDINCTVYDLVNELSQGHRVIVSVDANELWADRSGSIIDKTKEWFKDIFNDKTPNHALVVAGVEVNPDDPNDVKVILTDPGTGDLRLEYSLDDFMDAWQDSDCFMTTTTTPAPYQYDEVHECMIPSNFAVEQYIYANALPLNADVRDIDVDYTAYYSEGHLNSVGHNSVGKSIDYNTFSNEYAKYRQALSIPGSMGQDHFDKNDFVSSIKKLFGYGDSNPIQSPDPDDPGHHPGPDDPDHHPGPDDPGHHPGSDDPGHHPGPDDPDPDDPEDFEDEEQGNE